MQVSMAGSWAPWMWAPEHMRHYSCLMNQQGHVLDVKWTPESGVASLTAAPTSNTTRPQRYVLESRVDDYRLLSPALVHSCQL